jgi:predicted cupin superfamily sugar epimerase
VHPRAAELISALRLTPHPEGGYYRETFRSASSVAPDDDRGSRSALTTIFFLLVEGTWSRWHRVRSDEVWHFAEGAPVELLVAPPDLSSIETVVLGAWSESNLPVHTVPAGFWQAARPRGEYALAGCTVGPGFDFQDFSFLRDDSAAMARLRALGHEWGAFA